MREIKFRAWDKKNKVFNEVWIGMTFGKEHIDNFVFQQFTGLKDKNGKEICEGDICIVDYFDKGWKSTKAKVVFEYGTFIFVSKCFTDSYKPMMDIEREEGHIYSKVIGNIYENKEMLV